MAVTAEAVLRRAWISVEGSAIWHPPLAVVPTAATIVRKPIRVRLITVAVKSPLETRQRLIDRFLRYVAVDTAADENSGDYPSSSGQRRLAEIVADDLRQIGCEDVRVDGHSLVWAVVPATTAHRDVPAILFNSHLDTSPEAASAAIRPRIIERYQGGDIILLQGGAITESNTPELPELIGHTLIVTDGTTLLGGDDKAGVASIVEVAARLIESDRPRGKLQILLTCDEEIGRGTTKVDLSQCEAAFGYTLDGGGRGILENSNFSADAATVTVTGHNIHPGYAFGKMVNSLRAAGAFVAALPNDSLSPETTKGEQGFLHPYRIDGGVGQSIINILLRDFETSKLNDYAKLLRETAGAIEAIYPGISIKVDIRSQYRNMTEGLDRCPDVSRLALDAYRNLGVEPKIEAIRGGTDGAAFTAMGLPMPNLAVGQHNIHSVREFVSVDEMELAIDHAIEICRLHAEGR